MADGVKQVLTTLLQSYVADGGSIEELIAEIQGEPEPEQLDWDELNARVETIDSTEAAWALVRDSYERWFYGGEDEDKADTDNLLNLLGRLVDAEQQVSGPEPLDPAEVLAAVAEQAQAAAEPRARLQPVEAAPVKAPAKKAAKKAARRPAGRRITPAADDDNPFAGGAIPGVQLAEPRKQSAPAKRSTHDRSAVPPEHQFVRDGRGRMVPADQVQA